MAAAFLMMYSTYKLNKQGDNINPWRTPVPIWNQTVVPQLVNDEVKIFIHIMLNLAYNATFKAQTTDDIWALLREIVIDI